MLLLLETDARLLEVISSVIVWFLLERSDSVSTLLEVEELLSSSLISPCPFFSFKTELIL